MLNALPKVALFTALLLLVPALAMRLTPEVNWGLEDFAAAAVLLFSAGMACALIAARVRSPGERLAAAAGVWLVLGLVWAELAVGLFD